MSLTAQGIALLNAESQKASRVQLGFALGMAKGNFKVPAAGYAAGTYDLLKGVKLPSGAIVKRVFYKVKTTFTSAMDAATIALGLNTGVDVKAAIAISNGANPWDAGVPATGIPDNDIANFVVLTADRKLLATVAVETLTAGELDVYVEYAYAPVDN